MSAEYKNKITAFIDMWMAVKGVSDWTGAILYICHRGQYKIDI